MVTGTEGDFVKSKAYEKNWVLQVFFYYYYLK